MSQQEALFLLCGYPILIALIFAVLGWFWRSMELSARENDTNRYPRYGKHDDMREDRFKVKSRYGDKET